MSSIKSLWKWIVSAVVAVGLAIWGVIAWIGSAATTGTAVQTAVTAGAVVAATTAYTFSFGDKSGGVAQYWEEASKLMAEGKPDQASDYFNEMTVAFDERIAEIKAYADGATPPSASDDQAAPTPEEAAQMFDTAQKTRQILAMLRHDIQLARGDISRPQWAEEYAAGLAASPDPGRTLHLLMTMTGESFTTEAADALRQVELPTSARGELAMWIARHQTPPEEAEFSEVAALYDELLAYASDTKAAPDLLTAYVKALDERNQSGAADQVIDTFIVLFPDTELGVTAARLKLGGLPAGQARHAAVLEIVDQHPGSALADGLHESYIQALIAHRRYEQAIRAMDTQGRLEQVTSQEEAAEVFAALADSTKKFKGDKFLIRPGGSAKAADRPMSPLEINSGLASRFVAAGEAPLAARLMFAALRNAKALPDHLITGRPIRRCEDIVDPEDPAAAKPLVTYFLAMAQQELKQNAQAHTVMARLRTDRLPDPLRPYVLVYFIDRHHQAGEYDEALAVTREALQIMPASPKLMTWQTQFAEASRKESVRTKIEAQQAQLRAEAEAASDAGRAVANYEQIAELHLALNDVEQAIGTYLTVVEKHPEHPRAVQLLAASIDLLKQEKAIQVARQGKKAAAPYDVRIQTLVNKLLTLYPDSIEADRLRDSLTAGA